MKTGKILKIALSMVKANKLRSWLTIIGVIIGIASVMAIVTTGEYFEKEVTETLEGFGGDTITIVASTPFHITDEEFVIENLEDPEESSEYSGVSSEINIETDRGKKETETDMSDYLESDSIEEAELTKMDVFALRSIPAIEYINVNVEKDAELKFGGESTWVWVKGVDPGVWPRISKKELEQGRMLKAGDRNVVVLSNELAKESFGKEIRLNQMILLNGKSYRVIGILEESGGLLGGFTGLFGSSVYMPYQDVYSLASDEDLPERETYSSIELKLYKGADYSSSIQEIENKLRISRRVNEDTQDFYVNSNREAIEGVRKLINGLTAFLAFIAGISLLVGSTGIANTMFTSVLEKTKEIGIMKAIGAKNRDIMLIFLCNSAMISLVGGIIGILLGTAAVQAVLLFLSIRMNVPFEFALSLKAAFVATFVSILVGLIAGLVPAKNASELKPVDALRYE
ncbi:MAG: ABC transporter permease [Methanosarcina flavescens]|jgi:putative ABC transport system permease protein|uniref:ABC transporter permease n=1 Tax=Methanosarcina flavescens TaxID=1715806 RepID=A0A660HUA9_9EURY|nr:ABC transporter permease [Methanosarcina flavescens]AYK15961.1 ABC transporter permease [Methanosarcina flavescens]NLK33232.1 ABC transporter permease [Methanosarcina flavescens]